MSAVNFPGLERDIQRWIASDPKAMATEQSPVAIEFAFIAARHDIVVLADHASHLKEALKLSLKALEAIGDEMTVGERYTNAGQYLIDALEPARAAIAKATGTAS